MVLEVFERSKSKGTSKSSLTKSPSIRKFYLSLYQKQVTLTVGSIHNLKRSNKESHSVLSFLEPIWLYFSYLFL
jgi:hypothetical protein